MGNAADVLRDVLNSFASDCVNGSSGRPIHGPVCAHCRRRCGDACTGAKNFLRAQKAVGEEEIFRRCQKPTWR